MRRLLALTSALMFLELLFFAVLAPLLPDLKAELDLSTSQAGLLVATYAFASVLSAVPATLVVSRVGARTSALVSLGLFAITSVAFGLAHTYPGLLASRFAQGMAGTLCWTAAMVWLLGTAPGDRRGELLGFAFGISEAGAIAGPVFGGVAAGVGRAPAFVGIAVCALVLALITARFPAPQAPAHTHLSLRPMLGSSAVRMASWITMLLAMMLAGISVLAPLQQHRLGAGPGAIAAIFGVAAALGVLLRPAFGRLSDRRGPVGPVRIGLLVSFALMFSIPWAENRWTAAVLVIVALLVSGLLWAPAMVMLSDACVAVGGSVVTAVGIMNLAWPPGNVIGSAGGAAIAQAAGQRWAYAAMALPLLLTPLALSRKRARAWSSPVAVPAGARSTRFEHPR